MGNSLLEQLKQAKLVDERQVRKAKSEKYRKARKAPKGAEPDGGEAARRAEAARAEKAERDRALNRERQAREEEKARAAQVRQLVQTHRIAHDGGEIPYHFTDGSAVRRLHLGAALRDQLARGQLAIVRDGDAYALVPAEVAERIAERDPGALVVRNQRGPEPDADDEYAGYEVPDDLSW